MYKKELYGIYEALGHLIRAMEDDQDAYWEAQWIINLEAAARQNAEEEARKDKDYEC